MVEDRNKIGRREKIAAITLISASVALIASIYLLKEDDIFTGAKTRKELNLIWKEYNRINHPDKCNLQSEEMEIHMQNYHDVRKRYDQLKEKLSE